MVKKKDPSSLLNSLAMNLLINEVKRKTNIILSIIQKIQMKNLINYQIMTLILINSNLILQRKSLSITTLIKIKIEKILWLLDTLFKKMIVLRPLLRSNKERSFQPSLPSKFQEYKINLDLTKIVILNKSFNEVNTTLTRHFSLRILQIENQRD